MHKNLERFCLVSTRTIAEAAALMDLNALRIVLVVDGEGRLTGTITDGDLRRAMLARLDMSQPVTSLLERKAGSAYAKPVTGPAGADRAAYFRLLQDHRLHHLPIVDTQRRVVGLVTLDEFVTGEPLPLQAVIMAGGRGKRLLPLTEQTPKPMLPVGDRPLMELIIEQLKESGIKRVNVTTHHQSEKITEHFGDGHKFGVEITYVTEDRPLGTAGGLGLMAPSTDTMLVLNGDILTQVDFHAMLAFHRGHQADLTVAVRQYDVQVPFGVVECDGEAVRCLTEKPVLNFFVNGGMYLMEPCVFEHLPSGERFDMTDLIQRLIERGRKVVSFPVREYWLDIGQPADYEQAQIYAKSKRESS